MMMTNVQYSAVVATENMTNMPYRTGYEQVIGARVNSGFVHNAEFDCEVTKITDNTLTVKDKDGNLYGYEIGIKHIATGKVVIPQPIVTDLSVGDKVKKGDVMTYNSDFFEKDWLNENNVSLKIGTPARVAFLENQLTKEDACECSANFLGMMDTPDTNRKVIIIDSDKRVSDMVKIGQEVVSDSNLLIITPDIEGTTELTEEQLEAISGYTKDVPKSGVEGVVSSIEVFYYGELDDMSESIRNIVETDNKRRNKRSRELTKKVAKTGELNDKSFIYSSELNKNQVAIVINIDKKLGMGVGDKGIIANQLKTIVSGVLDDRTRTVGGNSIDIKFSYGASMKRNVQSVTMAGLANTYLFAITQQAADEYFGD